jgi:hypothetical protein
MGMKNVAPLCVLMLCLCGGPVMGQDENTDATFAQPRVARAQFTSAIEDREPVDQVVIVSPPVEEVFFFSDVRHMQGDTVTHNWRYRGALVSQVSFEVGGPRWRVFSKQSLKPGEFGEWSVTVTDGSGWPLYTELFRYEPALGSGALE